MTSSPFYAGKANYGCLRSQIAIWNGVSQRFSNYVMCLSIIPTAIK